MWATALAQWQSMNETVFSDMETDVMISDISKGDFTIVGHIASTNLRRSMSYSLLRGRQWPRVCIIGRSR